MPPWGSVERLDGSDPAKECHGREAPVRQGLHRHGRSQLRAQIALDCGRGGEALQQIAAALRICVNNDDAANRAESLMLYGQWLSQHARRRDEALGLWVALSRSPDAHATLKDELLGRLAEDGREASAMPTADVDLALAVEHALGAAQLVLMASIPQSR